MGGQVGHVGDILTRLIINCPATRSLLVLQGLLYGSLALCGPLLVNRVPIDSEWKQPDLEHRPSPMLFRPSSSLGFPTAAAHPS